VALLFSSPKGPAGALVELDSPTGNVLSPVLELFGGSNPAFGQQTAFAINPGTGSDTGPGTPAAPLRTMNEFNSRMVSLLVTVPQTLQLVGDVLDAPLWLSGTRYAIAGSLTVNGTLSDLGVATITVVTGLGPAGTFPWQLTTTGLDWTTVPVGSQVRLSTGHVAAIVNVVDASNVTVGPIALAGTSGVITTPTVGATATPATMSRALPPVVAISAQESNQGLDVILQGISFDAPVTGSVSVPQASGSGGLQFYGCEFKIGGFTWPVSIGFNVRACRFTMAGTVTWRGGADNTNTFGCVCVGTGGLFFSHQWGRWNHSALVLDGVRLLCNQTGISVGAVCIRNTNGPVLCNNNGVIVCNGLIASCARSVADPTSGNTGIGIDVSLGRVVYFSGGKPTVTGASDTRVGGVAKTYANIPYTNLELPSVPPLVTTLVGNGASIVQE
jgi:hypothetical protein